MTYLRSTDELKELIGSFGSVGSLSNFFFNQDRHGVWIEEGLLSYQRVGNCLFLFHKEEYFFHLFFFASDVEELRSSLAAAPLTGKKLTLDIVGLENNTLKNVFTDAGFNHHETIRRMRRLGKPVGFNASNEVEAASMNDVAEIRKLLRANFNPLTEQLLSEKEIAILVKRGTVLVYRVDSEIKGFIIYEKQGKTLYLRYWWVNQNCRGMKIGAKLYHTMFALCADTVRQLHWLITHNENAKVRYEHYGYEFENLYDYVFILG